MRGALAATLAVCALALASCVAPRVEEPVTEAQQLLADGKYEEGLTLLKRAADSSADNSRYVGDYYRARDLVINQLLTQADAARRRDQLDAAEALYRRADGIEPDNQRITQGLELVRRERANVAVVADAENLFKAGQLDAAEARLRPVLAESPESPTALALQRRISEERARRATSAPSLVAGAHRTVSLEFRDAPLRSVFEILTKEAGINFVFDKDIPPNMKVTISANNVTVGQALDMILVTNQLAKKVVDERTILVYPNTPQKRRDYQELVVKSFYLANADVKQTLNLIKTIIKTRDVYVDERLGLLVMRDTPEAVRLAEKLVASQDLAEPEVLLDVEVLEVSRNKLQQVGLAWPNQITLTPMGAGAAGAAGTPGVLTLEEAKNLSPTMVQMTVTNPFIALNLEQTDGQSNILANPQIRVKNHEKAKIHIGDRVPVLTTTAASSGSFVSQSVSYLDVGLKLEVQPTISLDNQTSIKISLEVSNIVQTIHDASGNTLAYQIGTRNADTVLRLKDGETQVLAGLISDEDRRTGSRVPGLGELPVLGRLFSNEGANATKTEIVLLITPHIVRSLERPAAHVIEFRSGTEADVGTGGLGGSPSPAQSPLAPPQQQPVAPPPPPAANPAASPANP